MTTAAAPACRLCACCNYRLRPGEAYPVTGPHALRGKPDGEKMFCWACWGNGGKWGTAREAVTA